MTPDSYPQDWCSLQLPFRIGTGRTLLTDQTNDPRLQLTFAYSPSREQVKVAVWFGADVAGPPGHVHGGVLCYVLDEAMGAAAWAAGYPVVAGQLQIRFTEMVPVEQTYEITTSLTRAGPKKVFLRADVHLLHGPSLTEAEGVFVRLAQDQFAAIASTPELQSELVRPWKWREDS